MQMRIYTMLPQMMGYNALHETPAFALIATDFRDHDPKRRPDAVRKC
jgi:hypothetical protein